MENNWETNDQISGKLEETISISGKISNDSSITGVIRNSTISLSGKIIVPTIKGTLTSNGDSIKGFLTLNKTPYYEISNEYGETVYIG
jgi:hypothetical protein